MMGAPRKPRDPMFAKLPRKVWVGNYDFKIAVVGTKDKKIDGNDGLTVTKTFTVYLDKTLVGTRLVEVVWHELTHCINWVNDIDDGVKEERLSDIHGKAWVAFFLANPKMHYWFNTSLNAIRKEQHGI